MAPLLEYLLWKSDYLSKSSTLEHTLRSLSNKNAEVTLFCPRCYLLTLLRIRAHVSGPTLGLPQAQQGIYLPTPSLAWPLLSPGGMLWSVSCHNEVILKLGGKGCLGPRLTHEGVRVRMA